MTDMRRALLWAVFTMSLVFLWDNWNQHTGQPSLFGGSSPRPAATASAPGEVPLAAVDPASGVPAAIAAPGAAPAPAAAAPATPRERVTVTTDLVRATFDSLGGTLVELELLRHRDQQDTAQLVRLMDQSARRVYLAQTGLTATQGAAALPNHLTPMTVLAGARELGSGQDTLELVFEAAGGAGVVLRKTYTFERGRYGMKVTHSVRNDGQAAIAPQLYLQLTRDGNKPEGESSFYFTFTGPAMYTEAAKFQKIKFEDIGKGKVDHVKQAEDGWVAMVQHYFVSAWLMPQGVAREYRTRKVSDNLYAIAMVTPLGEVQPGETRSVDATLYAGPQEEYRLADLAPGLERVKDYGYLHILSKPLFWLLTQLHNVLGNWGWAIVALVVVLKAAFFWLNASAYRSMAKMKAINPKVMEMRERLKDKPQLMQQEMMRIYREEKVNPLGGCLPIVVQMPFFIALYWVLLSSVEMRNAPWIGWIDDLSALDPYFILPLLMTASSLFQTWLNPTPPDPTQAKLMWIMPMMFSVMFFFFPAGLVLYWLTNNVLSIAQQWFINRQLGLNVRKT